VAGILILDVQIIYSYDMLTKCEHTDGYPVILDTETAEYYRIPDTLNKIAIKGNLRNFNENIQAFIDSNRNNSIVPVYCSEQGTHKKRTTRKVMSGITTYLFHNVERIDGKWKHNEIEDMEVGKAYLAYFKKDKQAENSVMVSAIKELKKGDQKATLQN